MDDLGFNKIAAAVLATGLGVAILMKLPGLFIDQGYPDVPVYTVGTLPTGPGDEAPIDLPFPQQDWIDAMDAERGAKVFKKCTSCHNVDQGGANGTGPNLWSVVENQAGAKPGFGYSTGMAAMGKVWSYEDLDGFLEKPAKWLPGTKMNFVGLKKPADRAAVIEYLRVQAEAPVARPDAAPGPEALIEEMSVEAGEAVAVEPEAISMEAPAADPTDLVEEIAPIVEDATPELETQD